MAEHELLKKTKTYLRSTLLSHKGSITTSQLNNDYRELVGDFIPYSRLQFRDLESFLSSVPDVCRVDWDGGQMVVMGVAGRASAHIKDMVARQKVKSGGGGGGGRRNRGYGGGGGGGGRPGYKYNNYNFDLSDGSDWENYNIKNKVGERAKLVEISKAVPAGFEDTDDEDDFSAYSCVPTTNVVVPKPNVCNIEEEPQLAKAVSSLKISDSPPLFQETKLLSQPSLFHRGPLPPSLLTSYTTYADISVSQATSPDQFAVQPLSSKQLYHTLSMQMKNLYTTSIPRTVPDENLIPGTIVAAAYQGTWYRAEVTKFLRSHFLVCLRLVDTGKMILCTSRQDIQPLWSKFGELPVQAVSARLAGIRPDSGSSWWQVETDWFRETVLSRAWVGVIKEVEMGEHGHPVLVIRLFDTSHEEDIEVGEEMKRMGLAKSE